MFILGLLRHQAMLAQSCRGVMLVSSAQYSVHLMPGKTSNCLAVECDIPFTLCLAEHKTTLSVNGLRGAPRPPLQSPRPRGEIGASHCVRLRTPACGTAKLDLLSRFASVRHPWRTDLVFHSPAHRFQAGTHRFQQHWRLFLAGKFQQHWRLFLTGKLQQH